eukprot:UN28072
MHVYQSYFEKDLLVTELCWGMSSNALDYSPECVEYESIDAHNRFLRCF